jgi:hypothetical protein
MDWSINHKGPSSSLERALSRYGIEEIQSKSLSVRQVTWLNARHRTSGTLLRSWPAAQVLNLSVDTPQQNAIIIIISSSSSSSEIGRACNMNQGEECI